MRTLLFDGTSAARVKSKSQAVLTLHAHGHRPGGKGNDPETPDLLHSGLKSKETKIRARSIAARPTGYQVQWCERLHLLAEPTALHSRTATDVPRAKGLRIPGQPSHE